MASFNEGACAEFLRELMETPETAEAVAEILGEQVEVSARSFQEEGVLTMNAGLVLRVGRRSFQLTVVESTPSYLREPEEDPEACPGCGCRPGDGRTEGCHHPDGCGFWEKEEDDG